MINNNFKEKKNEIDRTERYMELSTKPKRIIKNQDSHSPSYICESFSEL